VLSKIDAKSYAEKINESDLVHRSRDTYVFMQKLQHKKQPQPTIMLGADGEVVKDLIEMREAFQARIVELTHAVVMDPVQLFNFIIAFKFVLPLKNSSRWKPTFQTLHN